MSGAGHAQTYHGEVMTPLSRRGIAAVLGVAIGVLPAVTPSAVTPSAMAADPTPVPAPLVDLGDDTASPSDSPSASPTSSLPSSLSENSTPSNSALSPASDVLGGSQLGKLGAVADLSAGAAKLPKVKARTWLLADATTGEVLAAKNPHKARRPASTLKTLTALTLLPQLDPDDTWTGTARAQNTYGSKAGIRKGREYTIDELFAGLLLPSGNDAAIALAQAHSTVSTTVAEMNQVARDLQAYNTTAKNPSGLDAKGQFSTAYDLALIGRAAIARDDFVTYAGAKNAEFPQPAQAKEERKRTQAHHHLQPKRSGDGELSRGYRGEDRIHEPSGPYLHWGSPTRQHQVDRQPDGHPGTERRSGSQTVEIGAFRIEGRSSPIGELVSPLSTMEPTVAEETVIPAAPTPEATTVRGSAPQEIVAEPELSSLSPHVMGMVDGLHRRPCSGSGQPDPANRDSQTTTSIDLTRYPIGSARISRRRIRPSDRPPLAWMWLRRVPSRHPGERSS